MVFSTWSVNDQGLAEYDPNGKWIPRHEVEAAQVQAHATLANSSNLPCPHFQCLANCVWQDEKSGPKVTCSDAGPCVFQARQA